MERPFPYGSEHRDRIAIGSAKDFKVSGQGQAGSLGCQRALASMALQGALALLRAMVGTKSGAKRG